jgi:hypothetical protein
MSELSDLLEETKARVQSIADHLPKVVDPRTISITAKIPFKVILFREALIWRTEELARCACDLYERQDICSAIILSRAAAENAAAMWYLMELIEEQYAAPNTGKFDKHMMRLLCGHSSGEPLPKPINVMDMLRKADKKVGGVMASYEAMSDFVHPNWSGTEGLYVLNDHEQVVSHLGRNAKSRDDPFRIGLNSLSGALLTFEYAYNRTADLMPEFISICESECDGA